MSTSRAIALWISMILMVICSIALVINVALCILTPEPPLKALFWNIVFLFAALGIAAE